jgi:hypothetical protein
VDSERCLRGFTNRDIRAQLQSRLHLRAGEQDPRKLSAKISRTFRRFLDFVGASPWMDVK